MPPARAAATFEWLTAALAPRGDFTLPVELADADVLVIPGGNTFDLLAAVRQRELLSSLAAFLSGGGRVYGGSAGAILLGADIAIAGILDPNDIGLADTAGADLLSGHVVYPHYTADQEQTALAWATTHNAPVLAIPETAGVVVAASQAHNTGPSPVHVFTPQTHKTHNLGATWSLADR